MATRNWRSIASAATRRLRSPRTSEASIVHSSIPDLVRNFAGCLYS